MCERGRFYVSCIKIGGKPIIPPLMSEGVREECQELKRKAVQIERRRERRQLFRDCLRDLANLEHHTQELLKSPEKHDPIVSSLESQLAFTPESPKFERHATDVGRKLQNLTTETFDVTQYNNEGVKFIKQTPKLIRSNSYTLESPSPILLAHLEKEAQKAADFSAEETSISPITVIESPTKNVIETDIKVEKVTISSPSLDSEMIKALTALPEDCRQSVLELLVKQQEEQSDKYKEYQKLKQKLIDDRCNEKPTSVSISSTQSLYYSISSNDSPTPTPTFTENLERHNNLINLRDSKKERAASVIGAAVRGYLVRRLIRTEKVQVLIETIKDALLCAIQLHGAEIIDEADVELHRRLIQQVSAACYAFHDIFFSLSIKEQMSIIATDRQRLAEKAKRPSSGRSRSSLVSTPR